LSKNIIVIGGGIVGVCTALDLQLLGNKVTLIDRKLPGRETSYGNAGVLSESSITIINSPKLLRALPMLLTNRDNGLRYNPLFILKNLSKMLKYLSYCRTSHTRHAAQSLRALMLISIEQHYNWIKQTNVSHLLRKGGGWFKLFRSEKTFKKYSYELDIMKKYGVKFSVYEKEQIRQIEPGLAQKYVKGVLMDETSRVSDPAELTDAYVNLFKKSGGLVLMEHVNGLFQEGETWHVKIDGSDNLKTKNIVVAAGGWSAEIAGWLGYKIPLFWERGYHLHLTPSKSPQLNRAINDMDRGFSMAPMTQGVRITSGVEITWRDAPPNYKQIRSSVSSAREVYKMGDEVENTPWMGRRPTLVDSLPIIGAAPRHKGLWFNFGHQHLGLSMAPGSAKIISALISNKPPPIDPTPFRATRFKT
jgi:D-amino-acid dehydrogenase